jgi:hypothetical protein
MSQLEDDDPTTAAPQPGHPLLDGAGLDRNAPTMQPDPDNVRGTDKDPQRNPTAKDSSAKDSAGDGGSDADSTDDTDGTTKAPTKSTRATKSTGSSTTK